MVFATFLAREDIHLTFTLKAKSRDSDDTINLEFTKDDFVKIEDSEAAQNLFKVVVHDQLKTFDAHE